MTEAGGSTASVSSIDPRIGSRRPRRALGILLRATVRCPVCARARLRVIAYRENATRVECPGCRLRFSIDPASVAAALDTNADAIVKTLTEQHQARLVRTTYLDAPTGLTSEQLRALAAQALRRRAHNLLTELTKLANDAT